MRPTFYFIASYYGNLVVDRLPESGRNGDLVLTRAQPELRGPEAIIP
jgi:hypothetical protein